jgi:hypothetical protein
MVKEYTREEIINMVFYGSSGFLEYEEAKKGVMTRFEERQKTIKELEAKHVTAEFDLDIQTFFELCDRAVSLHKDTVLCLECIKTEDEDEDEDEDEREKEEEEVEFWLTEAHVPKIVWDALWV